MMTPLVVWSGGPADEIRRNVLAGAVVVVPELEPVHRIVAWARAFLVESFGGLDPVEAQHELEVERWIEIVGALKPRFTHHERTAALIRDLVVDGLGFDEDDTYADVARVRGVTSDGYLSVGVGHQQPPHRDTWWCSPPAQLNWWLPVFSIEAGSAMGFYPHYWDHVLPNSSDRFDVYRWNLGGRADASAQRGDRDERVIPEPLGPLDHDDGFCVVVQPGGLVAFSAAHVHATLPNTTGRTRWSVDFRTVNATDVAAAAGPANLDDAGRGTALRDFRCLRDRRRLPEEVIAPFDLGRDPSVPVVVFGPDGPEELIPAV